MRRRLLSLATLTLAAAPLFAGTGRVVVVNVDGPTIGFNDATPVAPRSDNPGTTRGQQRRIVAERAAMRWQTMLDTDVDIRIRMGFASLPCDDDSVVLASAYAITWSYNFTGAPRQDVWYPAALANKFADRDLTNAQDDISVTFNLDLDKPTCLGERSWNYGFDGNEGTDEWMYSVALHEIGHGLGMAGRGIDFITNRPTIYDVYTLDRIAGRTWDQMSPEQRRVSSTNTGNVVWNGPNVTTWAPQLLRRPPVLSVGAKNYDVGTASFGASATQTFLNGQLAPVVDEGNTEGPSTLDGCTAFQNASEVAGRIALVDRGTCTFVQKALNAQAAGAIGLVIVDNRKESSCLNVPPNMSGADPEVKIPVVSLTQDAGGEVRAQATASSLGAMLRLDPTRLAGTSPEGHVRLYAPCAFSSGSSIYHWDTTATPNLLMEPFIGADLLDSVDLTIYQLMDLGWTQPPRSGRRILRR
jgi:PA domain